MQPPIRTRLLPLWQKANKMALGLIAEDATVVFPAPDGSPLRVLGPVSLTVEPGEFVCLVGPSGSGKSTLARTFAGLQSLSSGRVQLGDHVIERPTPRVAMMFQQANLMPWRTIRDNIALPLEIAGQTKPDRYATADHLLNLLGLRDFAESFPGEISGGMAQRAALGRVMAQSPDVLLLDEPFGALDALTRERISLDLLRVWDQQKQTVLMVTHDIQEAVLLSDRVLVMSQRPGQIVDDVRINLPRPRSPEMTFDTHFITFARRVREGIS